MLNFGSIAPYTPTAPGWELSGNTNADNSSFIGTTNNNADGLRIKILNTLLAFFSYVRNNIHIGLNANYNTATNDSIYIGDSAGNLNTNGARTIAIGIQAGQNATKPDNINIGQRAGRFSSGSRVIAIGRDALTGNSKDVSIGIGEDAGNANAGNSLTAIGYRAAYQNTGATVVAIGSNAAFINKSNNLIAIGLQAGENHNIASNNNINIGNFAGVPNAGIVTSKNVFLGMESGNLNKGSNIIAIGDTAGQQNQVNWVIFLGVNAGINNAIANSTIIKNEYLPQYANHAAAQAAITIAAGGIAGNTYLYRETTANQIGYVTL